MEITRRKTKVIRIGDICIGGNNPIAIQSMTKIKTADSERTIRQIKELKNLGCEIIRLAVKDKADARALKDIKQCVDIPVVADIHFDWRLALEAIDSGVDKIRLNPGNIYKREQIREIVKAAKLNRIPIRVGVNSGSLRNRSTHHSSPVDKMVKSALDYIKILEGHGFYDIVVSLKASHIFDTIESYRKMAKFCDYPFHLGVTATGSPYLGIVKSTIALSILLLEGIGDTIRVSLTDKPQVEVKAAQSILEATGLRCFGPEIISCPTCGRCEVDLVKLVKEFENKLNTVPATNIGGSAKHYGGNCKLFSPKANPPLAETVNSLTPIRVAIMGCMVNGPGEAKEADIGIAFGKRDGLLFKKGKSIRKIAFDRCVDVLLDEILTAKLSNC